MKSDTVLDTKLLGQKLRQLRLREDLSQMQAEVAIDAAPGSMSRIESGLTNPTKETLIKLSKLYKATDKEVIDLLEIYPLFPTQIEITAAMEEVKSILESYDKVAYLHDDNWFLYAFSKGLLKFFKFPDELGEKVIGHNLLEIFFNPEFKLFKRFDPKYFVDTMSLELARAREEFNTPEKQSHVTKIFEKLQQFPLFLQAYQKSLTLSTDQLFSSNKIAYFIIDGKKISVNYGREKLKHNQRFDLSELYNFKKYK